MTLIIRLFVLLGLFFASPAAATVTSSVNKTIIAGNGVQTSFTFGFVGVSASDISVIFTNASGVSTTLTQGPGSTQYQITLNAAAAGQLWGVGGTVTYNPSGTPIASGTTLTILRTVPLTQSTTLQNQASFGQYSAATEQALDQVDMQVQQIAEAQARVLSAPVVDPSTINLTLPPAAQRANTGLAFDGSGNVIAGTVPATGTISSAMQPVVSAATLAAGRTAFGLGTMSLENINGGTCGGATIQDDGSGNARVVFATVADSTNQSVTCAFSGQVHTATGALVYTLPRANTLFNGFGFWVYALTQPVTFAVNPADGFSGMASGASLVVPAGTQAYVATNAAASGTWFLNIQSSVSSLGAPLNLTLSCSTAANALTCAIKDRNGNDPSTASPVVISFRDPTAANGDPIPRAITGALFITVPNTATVGTVSGQANRLWVADFDNAGTQVLCVYNSLNSSAPSILAWDESTPSNGTAVIGGSNNSQTWYCSGSVTAKSFRVLGYVESTQPTAGTWSVTPSKVQLFGHGVQKPGEIVQTSTAAFASGSTTSSTPVVQTTSSLTMKSAANLIRAEAYGLTQATVTSVPSQGHFQLSRGNTNNSGLFGPICGVGHAVAASANAQIQGTLALVAYDVPNGSATYSMQANNSVANGTTISWTTATMNLAELQI